MKIIDGKNAVLGRIASYSAKEALKGEKVVILNCDRIIITGNKSSIKENFEAKKRRVGSAQKGPKHSRNVEMVVKRTIRGMLNRGRGMEAYKKIKCYSGIPEEFRDSEKVRDIVFKPKLTNKFVFVNEIIK